MTGAVAAVYCGGVVWCGGPGRAKTGGHILYR